MSEVRLDQDVVGERRELQDGRRVKNVRSYSEDVEVVDPGRLHESCGTRFRRSLDALDCSW